MHHFQVIFDGIFTQSYCLFMEPSLLFSDVQKKMSNPAPCSTGVLPLYFAPFSRLLSLLSWHRCRKWLTLLTTVLTKTHIFKGRLIWAWKQTGTFLRSPSPLRSWTARFHTLVTSWLQSKQLISLIIDQYFSRSFQQSSSLPPQSWLHFALKDFCRHLALRLHFRLVCMLIGVWIAD